MSIQIYNSGGLRFWSEKEILFRNQATDRLKLVLQEELRKVNKAWQFFQMEGPILTPGSYINPSYTEDDVFFLKADLAGEEVAGLRPETTASSYAYARHLLNSQTGIRMPLCVWQLGKSFRRELSDGATAAKLRFNEFYQLEFQCIYADSTKADYRIETLPVILNEVSKIVGLETRIVESDRLPSYSESTLDIEAYIKEQDQWRELASCSIRTDFAPNAKVFELAIGIDRIVELMR